MPITWNDQNDAKLLVSILSTTTMKPDYKAIAKCMGPECTVSAVQHRIQRLKERVQINKPDADDGAASPSPSTPKKRGRPAGSGKKGGKKAQAKEKEQEQEQGEQDDEDMGSPEKKAKVKDEDGVDKMLRVVV
ncbi:hypothetical protein ASPWEDRAFT_25641 [Aspergillus wentii DTO 134E9]|uniref:Myb-like domain-containing protein n=1 Tax=Aspergillus wentii DTO 134E9 TaxID=1073089 RepID=A0A1L9RYD1_ASPWE|nr:uncharacterized protein ASPWEDRAFT_25641 [Aspergillus wentii DTO 134E9]KAI9931484.1 hypothetical protein MW887_010059 [Aspergillus wentii]OJJ39847.1 hypothetical protein ASPWEDRAFT_25641 [Aspergillus wentii DTO 134E9]